ncbi:MAG: anti-sigma factor [Actinomycetota bacterium]
MTHDELREIVPAMALNALPAADEMELRAHLEACAECEHLLGVHRETAAMLALTAEPLDSASALRDRVLKAAKETEQISEASVTQISSVTRRRPWQERTALLAAAAALLVAVGLSGWMASRIKVQNQMIAEQRQAFAAASSPAVDIISMPSTPNARGANGQIFLPDASDSAAIVMTGLKDPGKNVYELWLIRGGVPQAVRSFAPDEAGTAVVYINRTVRSGESMAVTLETKPGRLAPEGPAILKSA